MNKNKVNIIVVDDNPADARLLLRYINRLSNWEINALLLDNRKSFLSEIQGFKPDIAFVDYLLGEVDGIELIKQAKEKRTSTAYVLLTGYGNEKLILDAFRAGAADYLNKNDLNLELVEKTIRHLIYRKFEDEKLKFTQNILSTVIDKTHTAYAVLDLNGFLLKANAVFLEFVNQKEFKLAIGRHVTDWIPSEFQSDFNLLIKQIEKKGTVNDVELQMLGDTHENLFLLVNGVLLKENNKNYIYLVARNISRRKKYEQELKLAKIKAEEADRLKSAFLANLSHEIRTPLNAITGFSTLIVDQTIPEEQRKECAQYINESSDTLLNLITDIIEVSKIVARQIHINQTNTLVNSILDDLFLKFSQKRDILGKQNIEISLRKSNPLSNFSIKTDPFRLKQVLTNLLDNALKFTDEGVIEFGYSIKEKKQIEFFVQDTGIGISEEKLKIIFDWFRKAGDTEQKLYRGSGIGLTISYSLVGLLGGELNVKSESEKGSLFWFRLPYSKSSKENTALEKGVDTALPVQNSNFEGKTILIAEDEDTNFYFLKIALLKHNFRILRAKTGQEVIDRVNHYVDIILMDIKMPVMDGYEATKIIKSKYPHIPIIAQTAYAMHNEKERILAEGCDDYISKPVTLSKLLVLLNKYL